LSCAGKYVLYITLGISELSGETLLVTPEDALGNISGTPAVWPLASGQHTLFEPILQCVPRYTATRLVFVLVSVLVNENYTDRKLCSDAANKRRRQQR